MNFDNYFPVWNELNTAQKKLISDNLITQHVKKGTVIHNGNLDCTGLLLVKTGQLRTYILSDEGREITLYRLFDMDITRKVKFTSPFVSRNCITGFGRYFSSVRLKAENLYSKKRSGLTVPRAMEKESR